MKAAVLKKLRQPSTWAGLAAIYAALAPLFGVEAAAVHAGAAALGGVAVLVNEAGAA